MAAVKAAVLVLLLATVAAAQARLEFDTASIKPGDSSANFLRLSPEPSRFIAQNVPVDVLMAFAYDVRRYQITGGPSWIRSRGDNFNIDARPSRSPMATSQMRLMVQALLADRFQLVVKRESKTSAGFSLVVARDGHRMKEPAPGDCLPGRTTCGGVYNFGGSVAPREVGERATMAQLADELSFVLGNVVIDRTGLNGRYDFTLQWRPDEGRLPSAVRGVAGNPDSPSIFTAIQEQIGLRLVAEQVPTEFITVERVERPSED